MNIHSRSLCGVCYREKFTALEIRYFKNILASKLFTLSRWCDVAWFFFLILSDKRRRGGNDLLKWKPVNIVDWVTNESENLCYCCRLLLTTFLRAYLIVVFSHVYVKVWWEILNLCTFLFHCILHFLSTFYNLFIAANEKNKKSQFSCRGLLWWQLANL